MILWTLGALLAIAGFALMLSGIGAIIGFPMFLGSLICITESEAPAVRK